jgi:hypothetical protein
VHRAGRHRGNGGSGRGGDIPGEKEPGDQQQPRPPVTKDEKAKARTAHGSPLLQRTRRRECSVASLLQGVCLGGVQRESHRPRSEANVFFDASCSYDPDGGALM